MYRRLLPIAALLLAANLASADERLQRVIDDPARPAAESARDPYRNPLDTLLFFGIASDSTVVELFPGGGWYTAILAPYLARDGQLIAAHWNLDNPDNPPFYPDIRGRWEERFMDTARFGDIELIAFDPPQFAELGPAGSADLVVTFRNVHGWKRAGTFDEMLASAHAVLKPGGVLGIVGHRLPEDAESDREARSGYVKQSWVVEAVEAAGFRLEEASEINANPDDSADHPNGVWTLLPSLRVPEGEDEAAYAAIGESDRFTLKFVKD